MDNRRNIYPNLSWGQFEMFNDNRTESFEEMCKDLFICEFLRETKNPHADHNNPGVEIIPVLEPPHDDGKPQRWISYQAKYFSGNIKDSDIIDSLRKTVKYYRDQLDTVYLFCNKVISENSRRYKKYVAVLNDAQISLELVTDKDIFALLRKHRRVADYFFQDRKRALAGTNGLMETVTFASSISDSEPPNNAILSNVIAQELLKEKISKCHDAICDLKFGDLKSELDLLSSIGADFSDSKIIYYKIILSVHDKQDFATLIDMLHDDQKEEAYWLKNFSKNIRKLTIDEFSGLSAETQVVTLDLMFSSKNWAYIIDLAKDRDRIPTNVLKAFDFHYGLSLFNEGECELSHETLDSLYEQYHEQRFKLYDICALLHKANKEYIFGSVEDGKKIKDLLTKLDAVKELVSDQIKANEPLFVILKLQACFNLGTTERSFLDDAITIYEDSSNIAKNNDGVRLFAGLCYEMAGDIDKASKIFAECSWQSDESLALRYFTSLIDLNRLEDALDAFDKLEEKVRTYHVEAIYLLVLYRLKRDDYREKLELTIKKCEKSLSDLFLIGFYVEDATTFDEVILPRFETLIPESLQQLDLQKRIGLLTVLAHKGKLNLLSSVLDSIQEVRIINQFVIHDIYKCLFSIANKEYEAWRHDREISKDLRSVEKIADRFIEANLQKRDFLQIRLLCASANHMVYSMLKYSKELFEYTHDIQTARNIISLLCERNETKAEEYEAYLAALVDVDDPEICMAVAFAKLKLGHFADADYFAYKAIYLLNGEDNFEVYKSLFVYNNFTLLRRYEKPARKNISPNMIVSLESGGNIWKVVLDTEDDFGEESNKSLDADHISRTDPVYIKLVGKGRKQILNLRGKRYRVIDYEPREYAIAKFIYQKVQQYPDKFKGTVWMISTENAEEMVKQVLALSDHREQTRELVEAYNFKNDEIGLPIDLFVNGDYRNYIYAQLYLLYADDLAYYAGESRPEYILDAKYIPTLSTLVFLASKEWLDTLDWLGDRVVIPESYMDFFKEQYMAEVGSQANSAGTLIPLDDGKFTILKPDKKIPEIWETIITKCENYPVEKVSDDERISYEVIEGYTWERLFANARIDKIQLDALIVAERENGVYLCDDLFFRKIATCKKVKNINFATILNAYENLDVVMPILMELSKTNYIYTPFRCRNNEEGQKLINNLLEGEKKKVYYSDYFNAYIYVIDQIMKQYFGNEQNGESIE